MLDPNTYRHRDNRGTLSRHFFRMLYFTILAVFSLSALADLADTIQLVKPSVVGVGTFDLLRSPQFVMRGTGFVVGDGGLVATNQHVIKSEKAESVSERLSILVRDGKQAQVREATLVRSDPEHDLALLRISAPLPPLKIAPEAEAREGQAIAFMGFPIGEVLGYSPVTHRGIISSITPIVLPGANARQLNARVVQQIRSGSFDIYQLDATAYPGNSGGPLYEVGHGEVIGIINMVFVKENKESILSKPSGISFAIPVRFLRELLQKPLQ